MTSEAITAIHALSNALITTAALALFWTAYRKNRESSQILKDLLVRKAQEAISSAFMPDGGLHSESVGLGELDARDLQYRREWRDYLRNTKGEALLSYPEWLEKRKEASHG